MGNTIDTVICLDSTPLMALNINLIKEKILRVLDEVSMDNDDSTRLSLIQFRSHYDYPVTITNSFTQHRNVLEQIVNNQQWQERNTDGYRDIGGALREVLKLSWRDNDHNGIYLEKLVVLITDGVPNGLFSPLNGSDPWKMSNLMRNQGITLIVVGVGESIIQCDDFYCALAQNTGGVYIPFINAEHILSSVITSIIREQTTFHQVFNCDLFEEIERNSSFKYSYMRNRVESMINECKTMYDIRRFFYNHRLSN
ncbi:hypothetical protein I4U23_019020 [Adineta vaga]|nr:hypothetical protein I4U23_019020 [Adineta vaga]